MPSLWSAHVTLLLSTVHNTGSSRLLDKNAHHVQRLPFLDLDSPSAPTGRRLKHEGFNPRPVSFDLNRYASVHTALGAYLTYCLWVAARLSKLQQKWLIGMIGHHQWCPVS